MTFLKCKANFSRVVRSPPAPTANFVALLALKKVKTRVPRLSDAEKEEVEVATVVTSTMWCAI